MAKEKKTKKKCSRKSQSTIYGIYGERAYGTDGVPCQQNAGCQPYKVEIIVE